MTKGHYAVPEEMVEQIEQILTHLRRMTEAECVLLADISGQLISVHGDIPSDPVTLSALAASDVAAMAELSRRIGEENPCGAYIHEGEHKSVYMVNVVSSFILIVIFRAETLMGLVRLFAGRAAEQLAALAPDFEALVSQREQVAHSEFSHALAEELERAFSEL